MLWGHLISDTSLDELHEVARCAGLPSRAFDLDHYDWPEQATDAVLAAGAVIVDSHDLTRRLIASGLRVPGARRAEARRERTALHAAELGLARPPRELITGPLGHVDPLPAQAGAFRVTSDDASVPPRIEAHDAAGREAAAAFLAQVDAASWRVHGRPWTGQAVDAPEPRGTAASSL